MLSGHRSLETPWQEVLALEEVLEVLALEEVPEVLALEELKAEGLMVKGLGPTLKLL